MAQTDCNGKTRDGRPCGRAATWWHGPFDDRKAYCSAHFDSIYPGGYQLPDTPDEPSGGERHE